MPLLAVSALFLSTATVSAVPGDWTFKLLPDDPATSGQFGFSVSISGTTALVGGIIGTPGFGRAYLFDAATGNRIRQLLPDDGPTQNSFGYSVVISGATALVGAPLDRSASGAVYHFDTTTGQQIAKLLADDGDANHLFGISVALSGTTAIVGALHDTGNAPVSGSAYLFDITTGQQIAKLLADDGEIADGFGAGVSIDSGLAIVGAVFDDDNGSQSGSAYLFDAITGQQLAKLLADDGADGDAFGRSVAIQDTTAIVGAWHDDDNGDRSGSAYLFDVSEPQNPVQVAKLLPDDGAALGYFGVSVVLSGTTAIIGGARGHVGGSHSGSAYLFDTVTGQQIDKLLHNDGAPDDQYGYSVSISGSTAIVGAYRDGDNGQHAGAAYLFCVLSACDDDNSCTDDTCHIGCVYTPNTDPCDDGDACTGNDICSDGACGGSEINCDDANACTEDTCDSGSGCVNIPNHTLCNDDNECTDDICDPFMGCVHVPVPEGGPADDGNNCTTGDTCVDGAPSGTPVQCPRGQVCDPTNGECVDDQDPCECVNGRVTLCHIPPGNPANAHTITVGCAARDKHLAHGDTCGPCADGLPASANGLGVGSCCITDDCLVVTEKDCAVIGGEYMGDATRCVGPFDLAQLLGWWGPCAPGDACNCLDANDYGMIDAADLAVLLGSWGPCP